MQIWSRQSLRRKLPQQLLRNPPSLRPRRLPPLRTQGGRVQWAFPHVERIAMREMVWCASTRSPSINSECCLFGAECREVLLSEGGEKGCKYN